MCGQKQLDEYCNVVMKNAAIKQEKACWDAVLQPCQQRVDAEIDAAETRLKRLSLLKVDSMALVPLACRACGLLRGAGSGIAEQN